MSMDQLASLKLKEVSTAESLEYIILTYDALLFPKISNFQIKLFTFLLRPHIFDRVKL